MLFVPFRMDLTRFVEAFDDPGQWAVLSRLIDRWRELGVLIEDQDAVDQAFNDIAILIGEFEPRAGQWLEDLREGLLPVRSALPVLPDGNPGIHRTTMIDPLRWAENAQFDIVMTGLVCHEAQRAHEAVDLGGYAAEAIIIIDPYLLKPKQQNARGELACMLMRWSTRHISCYCVDPRESNKDKREALSALLTRLLGDMRRVGLPSECAVEFHVMSPGDGGARMHDRYLALGTMSSVMSCPRVVAIGHGIRVFDCTSAHGGPAPRRPNALARVCFDDFEIILGEWRKLTTKYAL